MFSLQNYEFHTSMKTGLFDKVVGFSTLVYDSYFLLICSKILVAKPDSTAALHTQNIQLLTDQLRLPKVTILFDSTMPCLSFTIGQMDLSA